MPGIYQNIRGAIRRLILGIITPISIAASSIPVQLHFYDSVSVNSDTIHLHDIASVSSPGARQQINIQNLDVGRAAPPGFTRFVNASYAIRKIQATYPRVYRIYHDGASRIRISTAFQESQIIDFKKDIYAYFEKNTKWTKSQYSITIIDSATTWKCYKEPFRVGIEGLENAYPKGTIPMTLIVMQRRAKRRIPFNCRVRVSAEVVIACETISRGQPIKPSSLKILTKDITRFRYQPFMNKKSLRSMIASRTISRGTVINRKLVKHVPAVYKGDLVRVMCKRGLVKVSVEARARESGAVGDRIWVENINTHKIIRVKVTEKAQAKLISGEAI